MNVGDYVYIKAEVERGCCTPHKIKKFINGLVLLEGREMETCYEYRDLIPIEDGVILLKKYYTNQIEQANKNLQSLGLRR